MFYSDIYLGILGYVVLDFKLLNENRWGGLWRDGIFFWRIFAVREEGKVEYVFAMKCVIIRGLYFVFC